MNAPSFYGLQDKVKSSRIVDIQLNTYAILVIYASGRIGHYDNQCFLEDYSELGKNQAAAFNTKVIDFIGRHLKNK